MEGKPLVSIDYDGVLNISIGYSRRDTRWACREFKWSELLERLNNTTYTSENFKEYKRLSKSRQDDIKDVGGFVGGVLKGGRRRNENLENRCLITLDADFAVRGLWERIEESFPYACCMYSTHKHCPEKPRYRILIPLSRAVAPDEYQAVSRGLASRLGMEMFDDTTHEPARLMYWPSTSRDGVYEFHYQDRRWLNPDRVLEEYENWRDADSWPEANGSRDERIRAAKRENPGDRNGIHGAFCRTYSVPRAIEKFLGSVYLTCIEGARYTYAKGSTSGGMVIYEDGNYACSFHGTDPAGGRLQSSFDLVRIHKFGHLDEDVKDGTPVVRMPSYKAMEEFAADDDEVKITIGKEKLASASPESDIENREEMEWLRLLEVDKKGNYVPSIDNFVLILENDQNLRGCIADNEFSSRKAIIGELPWHKLDNCENGDVWRDGDDAALRHYIEKIYKIINRRNLEDAFLIVTDKNKFHPVRNYLNSLSWDGVKRVETLFVDYLGAEDTPYTRAVTRKMLAGACARVFKPGAKFDYMLVLSGGQGVGKSQVLRLLGRSWFSDSVMRIQGKEAAEQLQGVWILEMAELSAARRATVEHVKQYISKCDDYFRKAYGKNPELYLRQCVLFGTTNDVEFLRDATGNRRFWPVTVGIDESKKDMWKRLTPECIDQIWAEALEIYKSGEELYLTGEIEKEALIKQELHSESSMDEGRIIEFLNMLLPEDWDKMDLYARRQYINGSGFMEKKKGTVLRRKVCAAEVWMELMNGELKDAAKEARTREIHAVLRNIEGWKPYSKGAGKLRFGMYGLNKAYVRDGYVEE